MKPSIRLNKLLARHGLCSRRKADEWIAAGRVSVDGILCRDPAAQVELSQQTIRVDGRLLESPPDLVYLALYKPPGVHTTMSDTRRRKTVVDLLPQAVIKMGVFPVGRLDADSEGLLLLTNDGDWSQILLHPKHRVWKAYEVCCDKPLHPEHIQRLKRGVELDGQATLPAKVTAQPGSKQFCIQIREGRNRQIRRMCRALGLAVLFLKRLRIGPIAIDGLAVGDYRFLNQQEIDKIQVLDDAGREK